MTSRDRRLIAIGAAIAALLTAFPIAVDRTAPRTGLLRTFFAQVGFGGVPTEERTSEINLRFLDQQTSLPRQNFSARWRGFFYLDAPQSVEFFAGGNDEVELRVNGEMLIRRSLRDGLRTIGRRVRLDAGLHELAVDYQQFGGSMALNIQRSLEGQQPSPFLPTELFAERVTGWQVTTINAARRVRELTPYIWLTFFALCIGTFAAANFRTWRHTAAPQSARQYVARVWLFAVPALLAPALIFGLGPHTIFSNNSAEFAVGYGELAWPWLLRTIAMNWLILFAIGCIVALISEQAARIYGTLLFAAGVLFWGQGNIWNADYGVLAGQALDLSEHSARAPYELAGWAGVLLLALFFFRPLSRIAPFASLVFLVVQTAGAAVTSRDSATAERVRWIEAPPAIFQFSSAQNVIHIVLDEFQADVFAEIFRQDRQTLDRQFSGFHYFIDHAGSFPTTSFSMPAMLAAQEYRNRKPAPEFVRDAFKEASIFDKVARAGYEVDATTIVPIDSFEQWMGPEDKPNWNGSRFRIRKPYVSREDYREVTARQLLELSLFRHVPHDAKEMSVERPAAFYRPIWMDRTESPAQVRRHEASNSVAFLEQFTERMSVGRNRPVYKLLHVGVPHRPIVVDRDCRFIGLTDMSRDSYTEQSRCAIKLVAAFFDRARALGIYDSSLIIVSSDHGTDLAPLGFHGKSESLALVPGPSTVRLPAIASTAQAIMLIKLPNRTGAIALSEAPTSHVDLPSTILDALGLPDALPDANMFRRDPRQPRTRLFGMYNPHVRFPKMYLDRIDTLTIDGRVLDASSWNVRELIWRPDLRLDSKDVDLGPRTGNTYAGPGWSLERREPGSDSDTTFIQALTTRAILSASLPTNAVRLVLRASAPPATGPRAIRIDVDGRPAGEQTVAARDGYQDMVFGIPEDASRPAVSTITLHFDTGARDDFVFKLDRMTIR